MVRTLSLLFLTAFGLLAGLEYKYRWIFPRKFISHWDSSEGTRVPASSLSEQLETQLDEKILADFFTPNDFAKLVSYEVRPRFWTDQNEEYLKKQARKTIDETIVETLKDKENALAEMTLLPLLKENLSESFLKNFIKTVRLHNFVNATFQFDLFFTPKLHRQLSFEEELKSNQLINLNDVGNSYQDLMNEDQGQIEKILAAQMPYDGEKQFVGGSITLWMKVLDTAWNPLKPIPDPKKNAVKGFLRFRKYIRVNKKVSHTSNSGIVDMVHIEPLIENTPIYYTIDVIKTFNLGDLIPKLARLEVYPGVLEPNNVRKGSALRRLFSKGEKSIETAHYNAHGKIQGNPFTARLDKLVYDYEKKKWLWDSHLNIKLRDTFESHERELSHSQIKREILSDSSDLFMKSLNLRPYLSLEKTP